MRAITTRVLLFVSLAAAAWGQGPLNIDTSVKGSRWPAFSVDSGTANAYVLTTFAPLGPSLRTGSQIMFFALHANTTASTATVDGSSAIAIKKNVSSALVAGDIPLNGLVLMYYDGTNFQIVGFSQVSCSQLPALTGDVTSSAGGCTTTLVNIPDGATMAGSILASNIAAPATPASGKNKLFSDSTDLRFHDKNAAGTIGTTAVAKTAATHKAFTAMSAAGVFTDTQFDFSDLTGSVACGQLPALTGDVTSSGCVTVLANIPDGATMAGSVLASNIAAPATPASGKNKLFSDSTDLRFHDKNAAGTIGTTAVAKTAATHKAFTAMSAAGVFTDSQFDFSDLTGSAACSQLPALTGDTTSSAGSCATTIPSGTVTPAKSSTALKTHVCIIDNDTQSSTALVAAQFSGRCPPVPAASTIVEIDVLGGTGTVTGSAATPTFTGTSSVQVGKYTPSSGSSTTGLMSAALATSSGKACALPTAGSATCGILGITQAGSSLSISTTSLAAGDVVFVSAGTPDTTQTFYSVAIYYTLN